MLYGHASVILAHVLDFDFRHVVTFFNKLSVSEVRALPGKKNKAADASKAVDFAPYTWISGQTINTTFPTFREPVDAVQPTPSNTRKIKILLDFNPNFDANTNWLDRWLRRFSATEKVGVNVEIEYEAYSTQAVLAWTKLHEWYMFAFTPWSQDPITPELKKIMAAIMKVVPTNHTFVGSFHPGRFLYRV